MATKPMLLIFLSFSKADLNQDIEKDMEPGHDMDKSDTKVRPPLKKHLSSTFPPMIGGYMSHDQLADHVSHQMSFFHKKYEPEEEAILEEKKRVKKKVKFKKTKKRDSDVNTSDEENEKEIERREYREGLRDRFLEDLELLRDYYKSIYKKVLNEKVTKQHKEFKNRDAQAKEREKRLKEKEEQEKHKVVIRLPKSQVLNDRRYKEGIQETAYHKIIKLEHQLKKQGYLCKVSEIKAFWDFILLPGNLERIIEKGKLSWAEVQQHENKHRSILESDDDKNDRIWTTSDIGQLTAANARPHHWLKVTHARPRLFTPSGLSDISSSQSGRQSSPNKQKSTVKSAPSTVLTLEQKFPKVEFPTLAAYTLVFGEQEPDPEETERELEIQRKEESKRDTRSKLLTMFSHALANRTATQRLMERNKKFSFTQLVGTSSVSELLHHERKVKPVPLTIAALKAHDTEARPSKGDEDERKSALSDSGSIRTDSPSTQNIDPENMAIVPHEYDRLPPIAMPLSLHELNETCPIKEAAGLSTLWVNPFQIQRNRITADQ